MGKNPAAVKLGKLGGKAKALKHDREQVRTLGKSHRKPDDQVSANALYMRAYRAKKAKKNKPLEPTSCK